LSQNTLLKHANFLKLWSAQSVSLLGSQISGLALPTVAVLMLGATVKQMSLISIVGALAFPLLGMFAATLVERWPKRSVMIAMDLGRTLVLSAIPLLFVFHHLNIAVVIVIFGLQAVMGVFHDIAYQSHLPAVVPRESIAEGNTKLELSNTASGSVGPALAGIVMNVISAPFVIALDAISYAFSAFCIWSMTEKDFREPMTSKRLPFFEELLAGIKFVGDTPRLGRIAMCTATMNFAGAMASVVTMIFFYRTLHLSPFAIGIIMALSNLGFLGAMLAMRASEKVGLMQTLASSVILNGVGRAVLPVAALVSPVACALISQMLTSFAQPIYNVAQISFRQQVTPLPMQARMHAAMRTINSATAPLGAFFGGIMATSLGTEHTLILASAITVAASLWFVPVAQRPIACDLRDAKRYAH
jgi:Transmembrane secretion effector